MRKQEIWFWLFVLFFLAFGVAVGVVMQQRIAIEKLESRVPRNTAEIKTRLTKWIYANSTLISKSTCEEIVTEVMKTKRPLLMLAIIELESKKFTPGALSSAGAIGWCQVMYEDRNGKDVHGKELIAAGIIKEKRDLWDTGPNIRAGAFILEQKFKHPSCNGNVVKALEGYLGKGDGAYVLRILSTYTNLIEVIG